MSGLSVTPSVVNAPNISPDFIAESLHAEISKILPIAGVSVGDPSNRATWKCLWLSNNYPSNIQKEQVNWIINNIAFTTNSQILINSMMRKKLRDTDWMVWRKIEQGIINSKNKGTDLTKTLTSDVDFMNLLNAREKDRVEILTEYSVPPKG